MRQHPRIDKQKQWVVILAIATLTIIVSTMFAAEPAQLAKGDRFILVAESLNMVEDKWIKVVNEFKVISSEGNTIRFFVRTYGGNLHSCKLEGNAIWKGFYYEFTETEIGDQPCILRIHSSKNQVRLEDKDLQCRFACGARAGLNGFVFKREDIIITESTAADSIPPKYLGRWTALSKGTIAVHGNMEIGASQIFWDMHGWIGYRVIEITDNSVLLKLDRELDCGQLVMFSPFVDSFEIPGTSIAMSEFRTKNSNRPDNLCGWGVYVLPGN